jgi:hypothetical protein
MVKVMLSAFLDVFIDNSVFYRGNGALRNRENQSEDAPLEHTIFLFISAF